MHKREIVLNTLHYLQLTSNAISFIELRLFTLKYSYRLEKDWTLLYYLSNFFFLFPQYSYSLKYRKVSQPLGRLIGKGNDRIQQTENRRNSGIFIFVQQGKMKFLAWKHNPGYKSQSLAWVTEVAQSDKDNPRLESVKGTEKDRTVGWGYISLPSVNVQQQSLWERDQFARPAHTTFQHFFTKVLPIQYSQYRPSSRKWIKDPLKLLSSIPTDITFHVYFFFANFEIRGKK